MDSFVSAYETKNIVWLAPTAIIVLALVYVLNSYNRLRRFPGPLLGSISDLWQVWFLYSHHKEEPYRSLHKKYGPVVRVAPNKVFFGTAQACKDIFNVRTNLRKSDYYEAGAPVANGHVVTNFFATTNPKYHDRIRKAIQAPFTLTGVVQYEHIIDVTVPQLLAKWRNRFAGKPGPEGIVDLAQWCHYFALDSISDIAYGVPYGFMDADYDIDGMMQSIKEDLNYQTYMGQVPWLENLTRKNPIKLWLGRLGFFNTDAAPVYHAMKAINSRLTEFRENEKRGANKKFDEDSNEGDKDVLDYLLRRHNKSPDVIDEFEIMKINLAVVSAGADSTAYMSTAILYRLLKNPDKLAKLRKELDEKFGPFSWENPDYPRFETLQQTPYLAAVIREGMRSYGVVRFTPERVTPPGGMVIDGHPVPGGVVVGANPWVTQNDPAAFGDDVESFRPERWLECSEDQRKAMGNNLHLFGQGKYSCLGQNISQLEIYKLIPAIVRAFDFEQVDPNEQWQFEHGLFVNLKGIHVRLRERGLPN